MDANRLKVIAYNAIVKWKEDSYILYEENEFKIEFIEDYIEAQNKALEENKNILFIYRSNYSQVSKR